MARKSRKKKSSSSNPIPMIIGSLCAIAILAIGYIVVTKDNGASSNVTALEAETYTTSPDSLRGSTFSVKADVVKRLHYQEGVTLVVQVNYDNEPIPIEIPASVTGPNINANQEYTFIVKAKNDGWLVASSYTDK